MKEIKLRVKEQRETKVRKRESERGRIIFVAMNIIILCALNDSNDLMNDDDYYYYYYHYYYCYYYHYYYYCYYTERDVEREHMFTCYSIMYLYYSLQHICMYTHSYVCSCKCIPLKSRKDKYIELGAYRTIFFF